MADDRLTTLISSLHADQIYFSLEFFPPKTQGGLFNLQSRLSRMVTGLRPLFVTITWGAGGSTSSKSLELAEIVQRQLDIPTCLHLTCTNMKRKVLDEALEACKELGVKNILALRGDSFKEEYQEEDSTETQEQEFQWAIDLVKYIRKKHGNYFCIGVAGYPEGHTDESHPEAGKQSVEHDLPYLVDKVEAGADFIMTQLTYDLDAYARYESRLRNHEHKGKKVFEGIPIIPGLMPVQSYQIMKRITKLSHAKIPAPISDRIERVRTDDEAVKKVGIDVLTELVDGIKKLPQPQGLARGLHFYTLNLEKSVTFILERCNLIRPTREATPEESSDSDAIIDDKAMGNGSGHHPPQPRFSRRRASSVNAQPHNRVILGSRSMSPATSIKSDPPQHEAPDRGTGIPATDASRKHKILISEGAGSLGREATWDEFPNGRWGPAHSPAYGEIDGYGPTLKVGPATARRLWGNPTSPKDITDIFRRHVLGELASVPWSDEIDGEGEGTPGGTALRAETRVIRHEILAIIEKRNYWTLASQPAVDGVRSDDPVFGWGPPGEGFVFQKAFVEFFCSKQEWEEKLQPKLTNTNDEEISWMKTDAEGLFESSEKLLNGHQDSDKVSSKQTPGTSGVSIATWGVFRGKEILSTTLIEKESFQSWGQEAFAIFGEWRRCFPRGSDEEKFLEKMRQDCALVNVVSHRYTNGQGGHLWQILQGD